MKNILNLLINEDDIYYFNLQRKYFEKSFKYQNFDDALENLEQQKFDLETQLKKVNKAIDLMNEYSNIYEK